MKAGDFQRALFLAKKHEKLLDALRFGWDLDEAQYESFEGQLRSEYAYEHCLSGEPYDWGGAARGDSPYDQLDFHLDLGCGRVKKGRIGIDRYDAPGVDLVMDLDTFRMPTRERMLDHHMVWPALGRLPFATDSIKSVVSHHALEHLTNLIPLIDEVYRVLEPGGIFRAIVPLFPSWTAVSDPDHKRYFMADEEGGPGTFDSFCGTPQDCWLDSFSVPYTKARFERVDQDVTPRVEPEKRWTWEDAREIRVALKAIK